MDPKLSDPAVAVNPAMVSLILTGLSSGWSHMKVIKALPPDGLVVRLDDDTVWGVWALQMDPDDYADA